MEAHVLKRRLEIIGGETNASSKNLKVAELVSELFREIGCDPVIVGGSAVEFYTEGFYVSGDVDICQTGERLPTPREREELMSQVGRPLGIRKWEVCGVLVDLLGWVETTSTAPFQQVGKLKLIQIEDLIAERILVATVPTRNEERLSVARALLAVAIAGEVEINFQELERVAKSPDYRVSEELHTLIEELKNPRP
jgi:hypothetical protein